MKRNDSHLSIMPMLVMACVVLHNICEHRGEHFDIPDPEPDQIQHHVADAQDPPRRDEDVQVATRMRNALSAHFDANRL